VAILLIKKAGIAALVIAVMVLLFSVFRNPDFSPDAVSAYKALAFFGGALILFSSYLPQDSGIKNRLFSNKAFAQWIFTFGYLLVAVFFIICGRAHFKWADGVQYLIPEYIPWRLFWTYFAGVCLYAGGVGLLLPQTRRLAAVLSGIMVLGWFFLLHLPRFASNPTDPDTRLEVWEAFAVVGIFFVIAGMTTKRGPLKTSLDSFVMKQRTS
jgi:uncharacterized membrane protein YphA (DoxX/SURF4 family)